MSKDRQLGPVPLPDENRRNEQYFFTPKTLTALTPLCQGTTACLCCPSLALTLDQKGYQNFTLLDIDDRFANYPWFTYYDLHRGVYSPQQSNPHAAIFNNQFDTVIIDPPFAAASPADLAKNAHSLIGYQSDQYVYVGHFNSQETVQALISAFSQVGLLYQGWIVQLEYQNPPFRLSRRGGQIVLHQFQRNI